MIYLEFNFSINPPQPGTDILLAELSELGFESFVEKVDGLLAYVDKKEFDQHLFEQVLVLNNPRCKISWSQREIEQQNWNEEWEKSFNPIKIGEALSVRAPFHPKEDVAYDIVIEPKMSFGTGHHETTHMMIQHILKNDFQDKSVMDMGCGTGVLAILSEMKGARKIDAIDIDNWSYINTLENIERNNCSKIEAFEGDANLLEDKQYDVILANINRNILLNDLPTYCNSLNSYGSLFLSGFYTQDIPVINSECVKNGLYFVEKIERNNWVSLKFIN